MTAEELDAQRVEMMLRTAKTKADLQELVRSLDARNMRLQQIIHRQSLDLAARPAPSLKGTP